MQYNIWHKENKESSDSENSMVTKDLNLRDKNRILLQKVSGEHWFMAHVIESAEMYINNVIKMAL